MDGLNFAEDVKQYFVLFFIVLWTIEHVDAQFNGLDKIGILCIQRDDSFWMVTVIRTYAFELKFNVFITSASEKKKGTLVECSWQ